MKWIDRLERKFRRFAIRGLMTYIVGITGLVFVLMMLDPTGRFYSMLTLDTDLIMRGQVWRLFTYIFIPPTTSIIFIIFALAIYYMIGNSLESEWGSFRFNLYYLLGMIGTTLATIITGGSGTSIYLNLSLFLAFARIYPDYEFRIYFLIPVKVKYLAWLDWAFILYTVIFNPLMSYKAAALISVVNYFIFFGKDMLSRSKNAASVYNRRKQFQSKMPVIKSFHRCEVCGITENENPGMEFRYCSKCGGLHEYCIDHLRNHEHKVE